MLGLELVGVKGGEVMKLWERSSSDSQRPRTLRFDLWDDKVLQLNSSEWNPFTNPRTPDYLKTFVEHF